MSPPVWRYEIGGKSPLYGGDRGAILEFLLAKGSTTASDILTTIPGLGIRYTTREFNIRLARWIKAAKANGVRPPLELREDGLYHLVVA